MQQLTEPIVVGVTGAGENTEALRFAVAEALTLGVGVTLVHAVHPLLPPPRPHVSMTDDSWSDVGAGIVREARQELEELVDDASLAVSTGLRHGNPGVVFTELSKNASMIVLQHRNLSRLQRIVTGATVASVAAHSHCPVVSVPPATQRSRNGMITAALDRDGGPRQVLEAAFAAASIHQCSLRLVHGWRFDAAYDFIFDDDGRWTADSEASIVAAMSGLRAQYADVPVQVDIHHEWPADTLVQSAKSSDILVIGRHHGLPGLPARLGSLARAAIANADCPVMVVPL